MTADVEWTPKMMPHDEIEAKNGLHEHKLRD